MWKKWPIFYGVALTCLLGCLALIYGTYQMEPPQNSSTFIEVTKMIFLCLGGMGVLLPITLSVMNSQEQRKFEKIENTFDLISKWDDEHLLKARNYTREIKKNRKNISDEQLIAQIEENEELEQSVILVTNYFEHVRFSLKQNRIIEYDESSGMASIEMFNTPNKWSAITQGSYYTFSSRNL